ncbi:MAG: MFS transporter [Methanocalculaceae archaeon]|jgi:MFS family permease|nr:MFS transporter [Methanocalculaceae archaeon]
MGLVAGAIFMDYLDTCIVTMAVSAINSTYANEGGFQVLPWIFTSYLMAISGLLLLFGKISDSANLHRIMFSAGCGLFAIASFFCGNACDMPPLILSRTLQGVAAAMMVSTSMGLITQYLPKQKRPIAMSLVVTAGCLALALGPLIGGILVEHFNWPWIFYINVPMGIGGCLIALFLLPKSDPTDLPLHMGSFDVLGAIYLILTFCTLFFGLDLGGLDDWGMEGFLLTLCSPVFGYLFVRHEFRHPDPIFPVQLMRNRTVMCVAISLLLSDVVYIGLISVMPMLLSGYDFLTGAVTVGWIMLLLPVSMTLISLPVGVFMCRYGCMFLSNRGAVLIIAGMGLLSIAVATGIQLWAICVGLVLVGLGLGLNEAPTLHRIAIHAPPNLSGSVGGITFTVINVGGMLGVTLFMSLIGRVSSPGGFVTAFIGGCLVAVLGLVASILARDTIKY